MQNAMILPVSGQPELMEAFLRKLAWLVASRIFVLLASCDAYKYPFPSDGLTFGYLHEMFNVVQAGIVHFMVEINEQGLRFMDSSSSSSYSLKEDITFFWRRRGGSSNKKLSHTKWCQTVQLEPEVISMSFIPISSLLSGVDGSGFLSHAINLYLRYKPPIEELHQFLEFQLPRQWAPVFGELPLGPESKLQNGASLQFSLMGPKLYVNLNPLPNSSFLRSAQVVSHAESWQKIDGLWLTEGFNSLPSSWFEMMFESLSRDLDLMSPYLAEQINGAV
ncbi:unnamed protein product [Ilex paraguariensis]|uniref:MACPF domain-containing protein n=1 Tax=Ilex paraguariensis TaxID=185542 RepID=A0ABC8R302_9AQUA